MRDRIALLTGAGGFIGRAAIEPLSKRGFEVHAITSRPRKTAGVFWHSIDLLKADAVAELVHDVRPTHLLHFAWYVEHGKFWEAPENTLWLEASKQLVDEFINAGGERIVGAGTCAEYDWTNIDGTLSESASPVRPASAYGKAKNRLHEYIRDAAASPKPRTHGVEYSFPTDRENRRGGSFHPS